jgi:ketosteroid isomerase-like protein
LTTANASNYHFRSWGEAKSVRSTLIHPASRERIYYYFPTPPFSLSTIEKEDPKRKIVLAAVLAAVVMISAVCSQPGAKSGSGNAEQELLKLEQQWNDAMVKSDIAFLERILAEDYMFTTPEGEVLTKAELLAEMKSGEDVVASAMTHDMKVRVYGEAAVVTGHSSYQETVKGKDISGEYRWTDTWIKKDGRWQCVADHASKVSGTALAAEPQGASNLRPELKELERMIGDWTYQGENFATPVWPAGKFAGKMSCRTFLNGSFVEVLGEEGGQPWYEIDGYDAANKTHFWDGYDANGHFSHITMKIEGNIITYSGTRCAGKIKYLSRGTDVYSADSMSVVQNDEISLDGGQTWMPGFKATFTKIQAK